MQLKMHMVTIEDLVPKGHFLRKLESALDLSFVYEETAKLYSHRYGRPPYDPVVMVKYLLVGYLYGIPSERQIEQRIQIWRCGGIWGWMCLTVCRITVQFPSCAGENRLFGKSFGGCLKKWWNNVSKKGWSVEDWWLQIPPM